MAGNFRGIQFSRKVHLQRFRDLIFADGHIPGLLHDLPHTARAAAQEPAEKLASDRSILYLYLAELEIEKWHESSI